MVSSKKQYKKNSKKKTKKGVENPIVYISMSQSGYYQLEELLKKKNKIDLIITLPKEKGKDASGYADFSKLSRTYKVPLLYTTNINSLLPSFKVKRPLVIFVNGWSQILKPEIMSTALYGCIGTHPALLPRNRGRAAIPWHFINEERYGGITLFYLDEGADDGPIIGQKKFLIKSTDNAKTYYEKTTKLCMELLLKHFDNIVAGTAKSRPQNHRNATYLLIRRPKHSFLDFNNTARCIFNLVRAVSDIYPLAFFNYKGKTYKVAQSSLRKTVKYIGMPGQIAMVKKDELWVLGNDKIIILSDIRDDEKSINNLNKIFKAGHILNE